MKPQKLYGQITPAREVRRSRLRLFCFATGASTRPAPGPPTGPGSARTFGDGGSGRVELVPPLGMGSCCKWRGGTHPGGSVSRGCGTRMSCRGGGVDRPDPALRCRQAGISVDALRAHASRRAPRLPCRPHGRSLGLGYAERRCCADPWQRDCSHVCMSASRGCGTCAHVQISRTRNGQTPAGALHARLTGCVHCARDMA